MSTFQNSQEEYVAIPLDTPDRKTLQALFQLSQHPTISSFSTSDIHGPPSFQSNNSQSNQINFQKRNFFSNPHPKHKNKNNNNKRHFKHGNNQHFNNQRNYSPFPSRSPAKIPQFNNNNFQSSVQQNAMAKDAISKLDLSHPFVSLILLAALQQQNNNNQNTNSENPKFEYSSQVNSGRSSRNPSPMGKFPSGQKRVHWADQYPRSPFRGSNWNGSGSKNKKRMDSRSNSRGSSYDSQRSFSNRNHRNYQNNGWNGGNNGLKGILKSNNNQRFNQNKSPGRASPFQKGSVSKFQYKGSVPKLDSKGSVPKINPSSLLGKRSAPPVTGDGHWECPYPRCRTINLGHQGECTNCGITKPKIVNRFGPAFKKGDWNCPSCQNLNFARRSDCNICQAERPAETYQDFKPRKIVKIQVAATDEKEKVEEVEPPRDNIKWDVLEEGELDEALNL